MTTATDINFGVEIETHIRTGSRTNEGQVLVGGYKRGIEVPGTNGWKAEYDGSISVPHFPNSPRQCAEFVSPILKGRDGLDSVATMCDKLNNEIGAKVNASCGIHITVTFPANNGPALARLITLVANFERALFASTGTKARENGSWSKGVKQYRNKDNAESRAKHDRYHMLNLTHIARGKDRVEFRIFSGTTNAAKIIAWVCVCLGLVELALNTTRAPKWESNDNGWSDDYKGEGWIDMRRMLYKLGWIKGRAKSVVGWIDNDNVSIADAKAVLKRLAKKYDGEG